MAVAESDDERRGGPPAPTQRRGWLSRIAPGVRKLVSRRETPDNLWVKCPDTGEMIFKSDLEAALWVTPFGRHMRIGAAARLQYTFDDGRWIAIEAPRTAEDPLRFPDDKPYPERLAQARKATGEQDAIVIGVGKITGLETVVAVQDFFFMGGSLSPAVGEAIIRAVDEAVKRQAPFVLFTASGGARMQEGALSLMQMARTTLALQRLKDAGLPYVVVLTDPTYGGVTASYAMLGDIQLAEPGADIGFSGRRVIEQTIRENLPPGFQKSEFLMERGMIDKIVTRKEIPEVLGRLLTMLMAGRARRAAA